jgi:hypothetical protein
MNEVVPLSHVPTRVEIERLEAHLREQPQVAIATRHYFAAGLYAREILIPAGVLLTGRVHRQEHLNILSQGEITVWTEEGIRRLKAPYTLVSRPGTKRVGLAHSDTVWTTVHACQLTDIAAIERELLEPESALERDAVSELLRHCPEDQS